ncbi:hypothetical protein A3B42_00215 [Candidatus Daviesbacteria bacterium RIFCSPLOWO2_01_FULL_38_10]|nr:MAG: hypothetical protein A3D02_02615 [Candidatus Daviesbacteria bacterium RIFCSPHIGHO2_02_FULL_39_41]OGE27868.1 MAG: hypothetical protein A2772_00090 [Candidatus Daviesbacteria bacterium RIFCSPHIGHO2_01_FULL_38_8b]OGE37462.1 MAG: hypothetical protein A3B42_00215 [Candidatus Daviesbacteria bacterium RIFCSPLOWO2_01_FULL_38_10]OGE44450.1 MAG: hypothetical protein A3E67_04405 [Candidatus Daviesbacteria bacterium RIFCSPHIGHO2_12_FULL_38_25]OGE68195.1 MAG: hypothetical protein A3H81_02725 [Candid
MIKKFKNIFFAKPILSVVGVFLLLPGIILGVYLVRQMTQLSSKAITPSATVSFVPPSRDAQINQEISFDVIFNKGTNRSGAAKITGVDLFITADPNIQINRFVPDTAGKLNTELQNAVINGDLRYAAVNLRNDGSLPSDQIITLGKLFVQVTSPGTSTVRFDDNNTHIVASGYRDEVPLSLRPATVTIGGATPPPSLPPGSVRGDVDRNGCLNPSGDPVLIWRMIQRLIPKDTAAILFDNNLARDVDMRDYTTWWNIYTIDTPHRCP